VALLEHYRSAALRRQLMHKPPIPPTISNLRAIGLTGLSVTCGGADCQHSIDMKFDDLKVPDETPFPQIVKLRGFTCSVCGSWRVTAMPDWRMHRAHGAGRPAQ
jgi:hypothetical protein